MQTVKQKQSDQEITQGQNMLHTQHMLMNAKAVYSASLHLKHSMCLNTSFVFYEKLEFKLPATTMLHVAVTFQIKATINKKYGTFVMDNIKHHQK